MKGFSGLHFCCACHIFVTHSTSSSSMSNPDMYANCTSTTTGLADGTVGADGEVALTPLGKERGPGMYNRRIPPNRIVETPSSMPFIVDPVPIRNSMGNPL
mmetsp:Transcript_19656/g.27672  ORF Transcript_19656/g.27672 Transcript_19656/m.27672 type:complete len:101 (+) Transcript_19656:81-383(+)